MKNGVRIFWLMLVAAAVFRVVFDNANIRRNESPCAGKNVDENGLVVSEPERKESGQVFLVRSYICGREETIRVKTKLHPLYAFGDAIRFSGKLSVPRNFSGEDGRVFDYVHYLAKDDVYFEIKSASVLKAPDEGVEQFNLRSALFSLKRKFVSGIESNLGDPHAALGAGLVVGEKSSLGKDLLEDFRRVGLIHIVVLSGYNITIIADALRKTLSFLPRVWGIIIGAAGIVLFGMMVGGGATVVRSCVMACIALFADLFRKNYDVRRALAFAALVMVIENPRILLYDPSFQLSFLATLGLVCLASPLEKRMKFLTEKMGVRGIVSSTIATQIFVSPYILYMMGQLSIIGMVVNILVLPFIPISMLLVFITGLFGMILPVIASIPGAAAHVLLSYELFVVQKFSEFPYASLQVTKFSGYIVLIFYLILFAAFLFWPRRQSFFQRIPNLYLK